MIEQTGHAITFAAFFTASKQGKTGLTVTVDVYRDTTAVVTGGSATEVGGGLYKYQLAAGSVTTANNYYAVFKTADATVDFQHIPALWTVGETWVQNIDIATSAVWSAPVRSLTQITQVNQSVISGSNISAYRGDKLDLTITTASMGAGEPSKIWLGVKKSASLADGSATLFVDKASGLRYLNGAAPISGQTASIAWVNATTLQLSVSAAAMAQLPPGLYLYDIQIDSTGSGAVSTVAAGSWTTSSDVVREV